MIAVPARALASSDGLSAALILGTMLLPPAARLAHVPEVARRELDHLRADLYLPAGGPSPGLVLVLGALREGRRYELLEKAARTIAGCGFAVLVPELGRLRRLVLGQDALDDLVAAAQELPRQAGVIDAPVGLIGFSLGGSLALVAAGDPRLQARVACVAAMGAYFRLSDMLDAAMAGELAAPSAYAVAASAAATLPVPDRDIVEQAIDADRESPLEAMSRIPVTSVGAEAQLMLAAFRDGRPADVARGLAPMMAGLSPEAVIDQVEAPVWLLHDERDRYVPFGQFEAMREAAAGRASFKFFRLRLLEHTEPVPPALNPFRLFGDYVPGLLSLGRFVRGPLSALRRRATPS